MFFHQKRFIPTFWTWCRSGWWKILFSPIRASYLVLDWFWPPEPKTFDSYFLDTMYIEFIKNFLLAHSGSWRLLDSLRPPERKGVWFPLSKLDVNGFIKNFLVANWRELMAVRIILCYWAQKRLIPTFLAWCTSSWWKIFFSPMGESWRLLDSLWTPEAKNVRFLLSRHDVRRVQEKFSSRPFERAIGCRLILASWAQKRLIPSF